jgi:hypothetical protein
MRPHRSSTIRSIGRGVAAGVGALAGGYAICVGIAWYRYGQADRADARDQLDPLLDRFMPRYDVAERHEVRVAAPAEITLATAMDVDFQQSPIVRGIIRARELVLGTTHGGRSHPSGLLAEVTAMGWGILADDPGREIVMGAVTKPWLANVTFRALPPDEFAAFAEPDYVKIAWTLRADPSGADASVFRTETRVMPTDPEARARFRWYWARFSPGILLIRRVMLASVKREAERRAARAPHRPNVPARST